MRFCIIKYSIKSSVGNIGYSMNKSQTLRPYKILSFFNSLLMLTTTKSTIYWLEVPTVMMTRPICSALVRLICCFTSLRNFAYIWKRRKMSDTTQNISVYGQFIRTKTTFKEKLSLYIIYINHFYLLITVFDGKTYVFHGGEKFPVGNVTKRHCKRLSPCPDHNASFSQSAYFHDYEIVLKQRNCIFL